jgi:CRISPR-associated RAMP protein (TIGR02581 family)
MFDIFKNRLEITGTLTTVTALRIGHGRSTEPIGSDLPVMKDAVGDPLIPGSSFKGALRSRLEAFLRGIDPGLAFDPSELTSRAMTDQVKVLKERHQNDDQALTAALNAMTDEVSKAFWHALALLVSFKCEISLSNQRPGLVSIKNEMESPLTGIPKPPPTVELYDFQVVPAGVEFSFQAVVENAEDWELGLLMIGLHQFESEQIPLGGGRSRGLGVVRLEVTDAWWMDYPEDRPEELLTYLKRLIDGDKDHYKLAPESFGHYKQDWTEALVMKLSEQGQSRAGTTVRTGSL